MKVLLFPALFFLSIAGGFAAAQTAESLNNEKPSTIQVIETSYSGSASSSQAAQPLQGAGCGV